MARPMKMTPATRIMVNRKVVSWVVQIDSGPQIRAPWLAME